MPYQEHVVEQLVGQDRNSAEGSTAAPRLIQNLEPSAMSGYQLRGIEQTATGTINYAAYDFLFGYDHKRLASFGYIDSSGNNTIRVTNTISAASYAATVGSTAVRDVGIHLPNAGFYSYADNFLVLDANDITRTTRSSIYPSVTTGTGGDLQIGFYAVFTVLYLKTKESRLALMAFRKFVEFTAAGGSITVGFSATPPSTFSIDVFVSQRLLNADGTVRTISPQSYGSYEFFYGGTADAAATTPSLTFDDVPIGPPLALNGFGIPYVVPLSRGDDLRPLATHSGRTYFVPKVDDGTEELYGQTSVGTGAPGKLSGTKYKATAKIFNQLTLAWTEPNSLNLFNYLTSYQPISAKNSTAITGLSSTQEGLVIFCQNETFLMRGDPSFIAAGRYQDFNINPLFPIGNDEKVQPGELGPLLFCIWKGEVYQLSTAGYENISQPVFDRRDRFVQVIGEVERNCIVCRAESGRTFYYYPDDRFWGEGLSNAKWILPSPNVNGGTRYIINSILGLRYMQMPRYYPGSTGATARMVWEVDMGVKFMRKEMAYARLAVNQDFKGNITLTYRPDRGTTKTVVGRRKGDEMLFPITLGCVGRIFTLTFDITGPWATDTIEAPLVLEFSPRDVKR